MQQLIAFVEKTKATFRQTREFCSFLFLVWGCVVSIVLMHL